MLDMRRGSEPWRRKSQLWVVLVALGMCDLYLLPGIHLLLCFRDAKLIHCFERRRRSSRHHGLAVIRVPVLPNHLCANTAAKVKEISMDRPYNHIQ